MNMMKYRLILLAMILLAVGGRKAAAQDKDFGAWAGFELQKDIKDWTFSAGEEIRTMDNVSNFYGSYTTLGINYSPWKRLKFGTSYQFILFNDTEYDDIQPRHRLNLFTTGNIKLGDFKFSLRERLQMTFKDESERDYKMNPKTSWRNRVEVEYNIPNSKLTPFASIETFYQLNNPDGNKFDQLRYKFGGNYKLNKHNELGIYGQFDHEINVNDATDRTVLGFTFTHQLRNKKKKDNNE